MSATRERILNYLADHSWASAADLARALEMTGANIRYHLKILIDQGQVQISGRRPAGGSGRPILLYNLSSGILGENLEQLLAAFLEDLGEESDIADPSQQTASQRIAARMIEVRGEDSLTPIARYNQAVEYLNQRCYHASWGASPEGPRVELRHCPYRKIALAYPLLCQVDQDLISMLFATPLHLTRKRSFGNNPYSPCIFTTRGS